MNNIKSKTFVGLVVSLILISILFPIAINLFYANPLQKTDVISLNTTNKTSLLINGSATNDTYSSFDLIPTYTNYTDIIYNTTTTQTTNYTLKFKITCSNSSAINNTIVQMILNGAIIVDFNDTSAFNDTFEFNVIYSNDRLEYGVIEVKLRLYSIITSNITLSSSAVIYQSYTDTSTDNLTIIYNIIPIIVVISLVMGFIIKSKQN